MNDELNRLIWKILENFLYSVKNWKKKVEKCYASGKTMKMVGKSCKLLENDRKLSK